MRPHRIRHRHGWRAVKPWKAFGGRAQSPASVGAAGQSRLLCHASLKNRPNTNNKRKKGFQQAQCNHFVVFFTIPFKKKKARSIESQYAFPFSHLFLFFFVSVPVFFSLHSEISSPLIAFVKAFSKHDVHASAVALRQHETTACFHNWMFSMCGAALLRCVELEVENRTQPLWECCVRLSVWTRFLPFYHPFS